MSTDYWIVKLNSSGNIVWQNNIGGNDTEILYDMIKLDDGGFGLFGLFGSFLVNVILMY